MIEHFFTKNLKLRKLEANDLKTLVKWSKDVSLYGDYLTPEKLDYDDCIKKYKNDFYWNEKSKTYLIELKGNELAVGIIHYWAKSNNNKTVLVALRIAEPGHRNKGYGTEAQKGLIRELFLKYKYNCVEMYTDINNKPEQRCLEKLDFENMGIEEYKDGLKQRQGYLYRLSRERYDKSMVHIYYYE